MSRTKVLELQHISKSFPNVKALDDVSFDLHTGEIHAIVGENGAGKSTLMKVIYGEYAPDDGTIAMPAGRYRALTPKIAIQHKIGMVHQEFMLVKDLTVLENIILGFEPRKSMGRIDMAKSKELISRFILDYNLQVHLNQKVRDIPVGEAQRVEIIKTLYRGAEILILDEPTAVLTPQESEKLFEILGSMAQSGKSIVFISHKLGEVMAVSDRITVMRGGHKIATVEKDKTTIAELANMMVGRDVFLKLDRSAAKKGDTVLTVTDLHVASDREISRLKGVSLQVRKGEVLGIAGVDGNGQTELAESIAGLRRVQSGDISISGRSIAHLSPKKIRGHGVAHIPEDRNKSGLNRTFSIEENLVSTKVTTRRFSRRGFLKRKSMRAFGDEMIQKYDIRPGNSKILAANLSGGNAQKIVVAREVEMEAELLIAAQPTRGVDIGSIESIRGILNDLKARGAAILLISADLEELLSLSDTIAVLFEGRITGVLPTEEATEQKMGLLMTGGEQG